MHDSCPKPKPIPQAERCCFHQTCRHTPEPTFTALLAGQAAVRPCPKLRPQAVPDKGRTKFEGWDPGCVGAAAAKGAAAAAVAATAACHGGAGAAAGLPPAVLPMSARAQRLSRSVASARPIPPGCGPTLHKAASPRWLTAACTRAAARPRPSSPWAWAQAHRHRPHPRPRPPHPPRPQSCKEKWQAEVDREQAFG